MQNRPHSLQACINLLRRFQAKNPGFQSGIQAHGQDLFSVPACQYRLQTLSQRLGHHQSTGIAVGPVDHPRSVGLGGGVEGSRSIANGDKGQGQGIVQGALLDEM